MQGSGSLGFRVEVAVLGWQLRAGVVCGLRFVQLIGFMFLGGHRV